MDELLMSILYFVDHDHKYLSQLTHFFRCIQTEMELCGFSILKLTNNFHFKRFQKFMDDSLYLAAVLLWDVYSWFMRQADTPFHGSNYTLFNHHPFLFIYHERGWMMRMDGDNNNSKEKKITSEVIVSINLFAQQCVHAFSTSHASSVHLRTK